MSYWLLQAAGIWLGTCIPHQRLLLSYIEQLIEHACMMQFSWDGELVHIHTCIVISMCMQSFEFNQFADRQCIYNWWKHFRMGQSDLTSCRLHSGPLVCNIYLCQWHPKGSRIILAQLTLNRQLDDLPPGTASLQDDLAHFLSLYVDVCQVEVAAHRHQWTTVICISLNPPPTPICISPSNP